MGVDIVKFFTENEYLKNKVGFSRKKCLDETLKQFNGKTNYL